jgi:hypothetical protein
MRFDVLRGHGATWEALQRGVAWRELEQGWQEDLKRFAAVRQAYLIYPE